TLWPLRNGHVIVSGCGYGLAEDPARDFVGGWPSRRPVVLDSPRPLVAYGNFIGPSSVLLDRAAVERVGGTSEELARLGEAEDAYLWIRLLEEGTGLLVPRVVTVYHLFGEGAAGVQQDRALMQSGIEKVAALYSDRPWFSPSLLDRLRGIGEWDELRQSQREGRRGEALRRFAALLRHPSRLRGALGIVWRRRRAARKRWAVSRDGLPTAAVLPGADRGRDEARANGYAVVDLGASKGSLAALWELLCRPTAAAYVGSAVQALVARGLGIRVLAAKSQAGPQDRDEPSAPSARR
ncbi:MAG TPA: hypothetical protein VHG69_11835, partial [Thermoleophilaceae bacterium]|nr:hypothetical protein [Thermoleophilaceae bacterium]